MRYLLQWGSHCALVHDPEAAGSWGDPLFFLLLQTAWIGPGRQGRVRGKYRALGGWPLQQTALTVPTELSQSPLPHSLYFSLQDPECSVHTAGPTLFLCEVISMCIAGSPCFVFPKDFLCKHEISSPSCPKLEELLLLPPAHRPRADRAELRNCWLSELCFCHLLHSCFFQSKLFLALQNAHSVAVLSVHWIRRQNTADITCLLHPDLTELHKRQKSVVSVFLGIVQYSPPQSGMRCLFCSAEELRHSHNIDPRFKPYYMLEIVIAKTKTNKYSPNCCNPWARKHNVAENWWIGLTFWTSGSFSSLHLLGFNWALYWR